MPEGGTLRVRTRGRGARRRPVEVEDTGPGLTEEQRTRLFTPYYTTKSGGTGLGLAIVQGIVSDHGGRVQVKTRARQGHDVHAACLPVGSRAIIRAMDELAVRPRSHETRILIVDDDQGTLASLSRAFALEGYTAITSSSAARAPRAAAAKSRWTRSSPTW